MGRTERNIKDSRVDSSVSDVDDENGKEVKSLLVHQRKVEEQGDRQGNLDNDSKSEGDKNDKNSNFDDFV